MSAAALALLLAAPCVGAQQDERPEVLVVAGPGSVGAGELAAVLEDGGRLRARVAASLASELADPRGLRRVRALLLAGAVDGVPAGELRAALRPDAGLFVVHPGDTPLLRELFALVPAEPRAKEDTTLDLAVAERSHAITRGLEDLAPHDDVLDAALAPADGGAWRALALGAAPARGGAPLLAVRTDGRRAVFLALGHDARALDSACRALVVRACEWAARGDVGEGHAVPNHLTSWERRAGWRALFDGATLAGWHALGTGGGAWSVADGALALEPRGGAGDLVTDERFGELELEFEVWLPIGGNTGVVHRFAEDARAVHASGLEYQLLDDAVDRERITARGDSSARTGALLGLLQPDAAAFASPGAWHRGRIRIEGGWIEHDFDGRVVLLAEVGGQAWRDALARQDPAARARFEPLAPSPLALQDHGTPVRFRSLYARDPSRPPGVPGALFDGRSLAGWRASGGAGLSVEDGALAARLGEAPGALESARELGDFVLELDARATPAVAWSLRVKGRAGAGGATGVELPLGLRARGDAWTHCRVECIGPTLRAWVDGAPLACPPTGDAGAGALALCVPAAADARVLWRDLRLWELPAASPGR